jgi:hypothetical protein
MVTLIGCRGPCLGGRTCNELQGLIVAKRGVARTPWMSFVPSAATVCGRLVYPAAEWRKLSQQRKRFVAREFFTQGGDVAAMVRKSGASGRMEMMVNDACAAH